MQENLETELSQLISQQLVREGFELFSMRLYRAGHRQVISIEIDYPEGGVTLEECAVWNRRLDRLIEERQWIEGAYTVEVSSPGLDKPLETEKDFRRLSGRRIWCQYRGEDGAVHQESGEVARIEKGSVFLKSAEEAKLVELSLSRILKAKPEVEVK